MIMEAADLTLITSAMRKHPPLVNFRPLEFNSSLVVACSVSGNCFTFCITFVYLYSLNMSLNWGRFQLTFQLQKTPLQLNIL